MPLSDYESPTERIPLPKRKLTEAMIAAIASGDSSEEEVDLQRENYFTVRGLTLQDITYLVQNHLGDLVKTFEIYSEQKRGNAENAIVQMAMIVARDMPTLAVEIISVASDESADGAKVGASKLPALIQINALLTIVKLSSEEAGGLKNLTALVGPAVANVVNPGTMVPGALKQKLLAFITGLGVTPTSSKPTGTSA